MESALVVDSIALILPEGFWHQNESVGANMKWKDLSLKGVTILPSAGKSH